MNGIRKPLVSDYALLLLISSIWGASFLSIDIALTDFSPLAITCWRILLAAIAVTAICRWRGYTIPTDVATLTLFAIIGGLNSVVPFTLVGWGQQTVNSAVTALLIATTPFSTLVLSHFMTSDERFSLNRFIGVAVGFCGVALLFAHELVVADNSLPSMLAILLAALCYSFSSLLIRRLGHLPSIVVAAGSMLVVCTVLFPLLLWHAPPWQQSGSVASIGAIAFLAAGPTAVAYVLRTRIVQTNGAIFMSNVGYLIPVFATLWAWLILGEVPSLVLCGAIVLIFIGVVLGQARREPQGA